MNICVLSLKEAEAFELHQHVPDCEAHVHIPFRAALILIGECARWVGDNERRLLLQPFKAWRRRHMTLQLRTGLIRGRQGRFRYPVPASAAHDRNTSVKEINHAS